MWSEALRRTGGRAGQVVLRAASVGCLAAAALLDEGARPAGVVLFAPVRAETIAGHAARERKGAFLGALIAPFLTRPLDVDLVEMLARTPVDTLVLLPTEDVYLPTQEARRIEQAAARGEGRRVVRLPGSHHAAVLRAWGFSVDEQRFAGRLTPDLLAVEQELLERLLSRANP
jgi:pimeloyl-ACP methyl ester carboxylesterase